MQKMNERIRYLRRELGMTQTEFGSRIGVKGNTITNYETGLRSPSEAVVMSICREFRVSSEWLHCGKGDMYLPVSRDEEIAAFVGSVLAEKEDSFKRRFMAMLSRLNEDQWQLLSQIADEIKR